MENQKSKKKVQTLINAEEQHLAQMSSITGTTTTTTTSSSSTTSTTSKTMTSSKKKSVTVKKHLKAVATSTSTAESTNLCKMTIEADTAIGGSEKSLQELHENGEQQEQLIEKEHQQQDQHEVVKKEKSSKKLKKEKQQMHKTLKASFNKFDALEKRELNQKCKNESQTSNDCRLCQKPVYKMEEIKAEKSIFHKNCFRCQECGKLLKLDNYKIHEGIFYCTVHFKLLFVSKCTEDSEPERPRKPELIIRENQPVELPPDVARASDKPDLGLAELQQLNLRSKFQLFESGEVQPATTEQNQHIKLTRNVSLQTKLAKLQAHGLNTQGLQRKTGADKNDDDEHLDTDNENSGSSEREENDDDDDDDLNIECPKRERPIGLGHAMHDIKTKFERGHAASKEERREERKQELQNIRSRLFMGKQARIKEMYQQAVAESEQGITSNGKKIDIEVSKAAQLIKQRFESGDIYSHHNNQANDSDDQTDENCNHIKSSTNAIQNDAEVFESAISKQSRNIFKELDANVNAHDRHNQQNIKSQLSRTGSNSTKNINNKNSTSIEEETIQTNIIKCNETDDVNDISQIPSTNELSEKFKFFERYQPQTPQRKQFRITPPRDGVVKMPTPPPSTTASNNVNDDEEKYLIEKTQTTSRMLDKFRQIERQKDDHNNGVGYEPKPLKCFTPPPEGERRYHQHTDSDYEDDDDEDESDYDDNVNDDDYEYDQQLYQKTVLNDAALQEAKALARTQQLRKKFEKWEDEEKECERNENPMDVYSKEVSDDSNIESTKVIRQHFENLKNLQQTATSKVRHQVNRFV